MSDALAKLFNLGNNHFRQERFVDALAAYDASLALAPDHPRVLLNRGLTLRKLGRLDEALVALQISAEREPAEIQALSLRATILASLRRTDQLISTLKEAIARRPDTASLHSRLAGALRLAGRHGEACGAYKRALSLEPTGELKELMGRCQLALGEFEPGWRSFESRYEPYSAEPLLNLAPRWNGQPLVDRTIVVYAEQGFGDTIMFCRYLPIMAAAGAKVLFAPQPQLRRLMRGLHAPTGSIRMIDPADPDLSFDYRVRTMSLPFAHRTLLETIPDPSPYLSAEPELIAKWQRRLGKQGFKIGVAWCGSDHAYTQRRNFDPLQLRMLAQLPGVRLISLQKDDPTYSPNALAALGIECLFPEPDAGADAFVDTAAIISSLDLVITLDSAIAHLSGALGVKTWVALPHPSEWRWMEQRADSPWYPRTTLFRQPTTDDWTGAFAKITAVLRQQLSCRSP